MAKNRYYSPDEIYEIMTQAERAYEAWTNAPARLVAKEMYQLGNLLGIIEKPPKGNGRAPVVCDYNAEEPPEAPWECDT